MPNLTLITMSQGNPKALRRTFESLSTVCQHIVYGDLLVFEDDRETVTRWKADFNLTVVPLAFNHIFAHGFSATLNLLASYSPTPWALYMNCGEIIDPRFPLHLSEITDDYNCCFFRHHTEEHLWVRMYLRNALAWSGLIHEEVDGDRRRTAPTEIFYMDDLPKDADDPFKVKVCDDVKEICYFQQYVNLCSTPSLLGKTHPNWLWHAFSSQSSYRQRLSAKGERYNAFLNNNLNAYMQHAKLDFNP